MISDDVLDVPPRLVEVGCFSTVPRPAYEETLAPSIDEVMELARSLDGRSFDQVVVEVEVQGAIWRVYLLGNAEERMQLTINDGGTFYRVVEPTASRGDEVRIQSGGVMIEVPKRQLAPAGTVLKALRRFLVSGELDDSVAWETEPSVISLPDHSDREFD